MQPDDLDKPKRLLGQAVDVRYYDDGRALTEYVWKNYHHLLTGLEHRAGCYTVPIVSTSDEKKLQLIHKALERDYGPVDDAAVIDALKDGQDAFRDRVRDRLLREYAKDVLINRCPACGRIVRSPLAHQCPWCRHSWHGCDNKAS